MDDVHAEIRQEIRELAHALVRLEMWTREAHARRQWIRVGELNEQRERLRERRSQLMHDIWTPRRRPAARAEEVKREATV